MAFAILMFAGGLALFIFGMQMMSDGLRAASGSALRAILAKATAGPWRGLFWGTVLGVLAHSGAATTMTVSFVNAGLVPLNAALSLIYGANAGTALAMQLFSLNLGMIAWGVVAGGYLMHALARNARLRHAGLAVIGFGLIFVGMETVSAAIAPYRDTMAPWLAHIRGDTWGSRLLGIGISAALAAVLTSSGAMIGLCFTLINAGLLTTFDSFFPIVAGARIGTCAVALVASISMNCEARRTAASHLLFNVFNVILALALYPLFRLAIEATAGEPLRQAANLHVLMMLAAALPLLPFDRRIAALLRRLVMPAAALPEPSHLNPGLLTRPERAIYATIHEIRRMAKLCSRNMIINGELMLRHRADMRRALDANEAVINEIRLAVGGYLEQLTGYNLSDRQTIFVQQLDRCMKDIERIGDYQNSIAKTTSLRRSRPANIPETIFTAWFDLYCSAQKVLMLLERCLNPDSEPFQAMAPRLLAARDNFSALSGQAKTLFAAAARERRISSTAAYYLHRYQADLDRMMGHVRSIAVSLGQPEFWVRASKLEQVEMPVVHVTSEPPLKPQEYLTRLYSDEMTNWKM